jgi:hypothetical protein
VRGACDLTGFGHGGTVQWVASPGGPGWVSASLFRSLQPASSHARGAGLVAQQPVHAFLYEPFLSAPDAGLAFAGAAHDLDGAEPIGDQQHDLRPPDVFCGLLRSPTIASAEHGRRRLPQQ